MSAKSKITRLAVATVIALAVGIVVLLVLLAVNVFQTLLTQRMLVDTVISNSGSKDAIKVLFIGNSLTYVNMLPAAVNEFIRSGMNKPTKIWQVVVPGETLFGHWKTAEAQRLITYNGPWDYVILQGQSGEPIDDPKQLVEYARRFDSLIKAAHSHTILFATFADNGMAKRQEQITAVYKTLGTHLNAIVAPVGDAFFFMSNRPDKLDPYLADQHHPSQYGTYLAACIVYEYLFGKDPHGLPAHVAFFDRLRHEDVPTIDITADQAQALQNIAWDYYRAHPAEASTAAAG